MSTSARASATASSNIFCFVIMERIFFLVRNHRHVDLAAPRLKARPPVAVEAKHPEVEVERSVTAMATSSAPIRMCVGCLSGLSDLSHRHSPRKYQTSHQETTRRQCGLPASRMRYRTFPAHSPAALDRSHPPSSRRHGPPELNVIQRPSGDHCGYHCAPGRANNSVSSVPSTLIT